MTTPETTKPRPRQDHAKKAAPRRSGQDAAAESVDRDPDPAKTPEDKTPAVSREDEPRGQPTSDRFHTEQAQRKAPDKA
jgi:hypothetical protein